MTHPTARLLGLGSRVMVRAGPCLALLLVGCGGVPDPLGEAQGMLCGYDESLESPYTNDLPDPLACLRVTVDWQQYRVSPVGLRSCDVRDMGWTCIIVPPRTDFAVWHLPDVPLQVRPELDLVAVDCDAVCPPESQL